MPPLTATTAVTTWEFAPLVSVALAVLAVTYLAGVRAPDLAAYNTYLASLDP